MQVVIAYDGSDSARAAVDDLRRAGMPCKANALVVSVGETFLPTPSPSTAVLRGDALSHRIAGTLVQARAETGQAIAKARALAREGSQRVHGHFPHWGVYADPVVGAPADAVMQKAVDWQADLIVVGWHGRSALGRLVLGSVSKQVATESHCSVRVVRHVVERGSAPVRIVVGVDGSSDAEGVIHAVASRAWPRGTEARVIAVEDTVRPSGTIRLLRTAAAWISESNEEQIAQGRAMVEQAASELLEAGLQVSMRNPTGSPQPTLSEEAAAWEADCIFVGARGFTSARERVRAGSVSTALVAHAPCSVEVIRARCALGRVTRSDATSLSIMPCD